MKQMKRFIDIGVPITYCNLNCHYCYVAKNNIRDSKKTCFKYSADYIGKALTKKRLGGVCHFNICGEGETLIPPEITQIIKVLLENGHYIMVVTNGLITKRFEEIVQFPQDILLRLGFKFSFHYLELLRTGQMETFFENISMIKKAGCSFSVELTPSDELMPYIEDVKVCMQSRLGALCHITVPREGNAGNIPLMSKYSLKDFQNIWSTFESPLLEFKLSTWGIKRREFCYAGAWSGLLDIEDGELYACYGSAFHQNIFKDISKPIKFKPVGKHCTQPHCWNSHSLLGLGLIPGIGDKLSYAEMRDRKCADGSSWLNEEMNNFLSQKLYDNNIEFNLNSKVTNEISYYKAVVDSQMKKIKTISKALYKKI